MNVGANPVLEATSTATEISANTTSMAYSQPLPQSQAVPADQVRAAVSQNLVTGSTSTTTFAGVGQKSMPEEDGPPEILRG